MFRLTVTPLVALVVASALIPATAEETERAYLGVLLKEVPEEVAAHLDIKGGFMVQDILPGSPAEKAKIKRHDIIVAVDGKKATSLATVTETIQKHKPGDSVKLDIRRGKETLEIDVELGVYQETERTGKQETEEDTEQPKPKPKKPEEKKPGFLGVRFEPVSRLLAEHLDLEEGVGSVIADVLKDSAAAKAGLSKNDILLAVEGQEIRHEKAVDSFKSRHAGDKIRLKIIHRGKSKEVDVTLGERPKELSSAFDPRGMIELLPLLQRGRGDLEQLFYELPKFRGRLLFKDRDGVHKLFELPEWNQRDLDDLGATIEKQFHENYKNLPKDLRDNIGEIEARLKALLERMDEGSLEFDFELPDVDVAPGGSSRTAISKIHEDGYEITVRDDNGRRTISVVRDGKTIAQDITVDKLEDLPADVRDRVEKALKRLPRTRDGGARSDDKRLFRLEKTKKPESRSLKI